MCNENKSCKHIHIHLLPEDPTAWISMIFIAIAIAIGFGR